MNKVDVGLHLLDFDVCPCPQSHQNHCHDYRREGINIMHNARIRSESAEGRPTLLYITEVKSDFQTNGQKNHEGHQRDPEPSPQGHWSPHLTAFVVLNNSVAIFQRLFLEIWAIGCELPIYLIGFVEESLSWRPRQCVQT